MWSLLLRVSRRLLASHLSSPLFNTSFLFTPPPHKPPTHPSALLLHPPFFSFSIIKTLISPFFTLRTLYNLSSALDLTFKHYHRITCKWKHLQFSETSVKFCNFSYSVWRCEFCSFLWSSMVSMSNDGATCKSEATVVTDHFPVGLRVLVVDDDVVCLRIIEQMLRRCNYSGVFSSTTSFQFLFILVFFI